MRCVWCGAEDVKTRKDGKVFFCTECNMPLIFELEDDYVEVVKASEFRLEEWIEDDVNDKRIPSSEKTEATTAATQPTILANLTDNAL